MGGDSYTSARESERDRKDHFEDSNVFCLISIGLCFSYKNYNDFYVSQIISIHTKN